MSADIVTNGEIVRSAWARKKDYPNETCPGCKNRNTDQVMHPAIVARYQAVLKTPKVVVYECSFCGGSHCVVN